MKGAVLIVGVAGTAWTVERAIGYTAANNNTTEALLMERHGKTSKAPKAGKTKGGGKGKEEVSKYFYVSRISLGIICENEGVD